MAIREDWIFVHAVMPRSGSTLMQRALNACQGVHIWGETNAANHLFRLFEAIQKHENSGGDDLKRRFLSGDKNVWSAHVVPDTVIVRRAIRSMMNEMFVLDNKRPGMKEISFSRPVIEFLASLFPRAKFILLVRNPFDTYESLKSQTWWHSFKQNHNFDATKFANNWKWRANGYSIIADEMPDRAMLVRYEDLRWEQWMAIYEFLNLEVDARALEPVIDARIGHTDKKQSLAQAERDEIRSICEDAYARLYKQAL